MLATHISASTAVVIVDMGGSPGEVSEEPVTWEKLKKDWRMSCDVDEATKRLLILPHFCRFTYITAHSLTLLLLHLHHSSFSNPSVASLTSQLILPHFCSFTYITAHSGLIYKLNILRTVILNYC